MVTAGTIEELLDKPLTEARLELAANFTSVEDLRNHHGKALGLPRVAEFREALEDYVMRAEEIADRLVGENGIVLKEFERANTETRHAWQVFGVCYDHPVPKTVAVASLPTEETDKFPTVEAALRNRRFSYADLTHSYHTETIDAQGIVMCKEHSAPVVWEVGAKVRRLVPRPKLKPEATESAIIEELAQIFYKNIGTNGKAEKVKAGIRRNLEILLRVGEGGIYKSIYEALEQTSHRSITAPHIAKHADLARLDQKFKSLIGYSAQTRTLTAQQLAQQLKETELFEAIGQLASGYIPAPLVVTNQRTKGQTLVDKATVREHYNELLDAFSRRKLQRYYATLDFKKLGIATPESMRQQPPNMDDIVGVQALTHSTDDYDMSGSMFGRRYYATPKQIEEGRASAHAILMAIAEIPEDLHGYERAAPEKTNGRKQRMPPDKDKPKFRVLGIQITSTGLSVDLVPSPIGKFDNYFVDPKDTGYRALHTVVGLEGAVVEFQVKPNYVDTGERLVPEREEYKTIRAAQIRYLRETELLSEMEWEVNKLLLMPGSGTYVETGLLKTSGGKKQPHSQPRDLQLAAPSARN